MSPLWRLTLTPRRTIFSFAKKSIWPLPPSSGISIPQQELVDEEICPDYNSANFYPAKPGQYWPRNFNYLSRLAGGHNQLCGSLEIFQGTDIRNRIICLLPVYYSGTDSGSYNQDSNGILIKQWLWK